MGIKGRLKGISRGTKVALGVAGGAALGYGAYRLGKKIFGKKKRIRSNSTLRRRIERKALKLKEKELDRKLFKEMTRIL